MEENGVFDAEQTRKMIQDLGTFAEEEAAKDTEEATIKFIASVWKVSTTADGGIRIVIDSEESTREHLPFLAWCQQNDIALEIEATKLEE